MRKFLLASFALLCCSAASWATFNVLEINLQDGTTVQVPINSELNLSFTDAEFVALGGDVDVTVPKEGILSFVHNTESGLAQIGEDAAYECLLGEVRFHNLPENTRIALISAAGHTISSSIASGDAVISLDGLSAGVYVVAYGDRSFKVTVK